MCIDNSKPFYLALGEKDGKREIEWRHSVESFRSLTELKFSDMKALNQCWFKWLGDGIAKEPNEENRKRVVEEERDRKWNVCDHSVIVPIKVRADDAFDCKYWIKSHSKLITSNWSYGAMLFTADREWVRVRVRDKETISQSHYRSRKYVRLQYVCMCGDHRASMYFP